MGLSDLSKEENKGQDYFTGGQASGMVVRDPQKKDGANIVNELMDNARRLGGQEVDPEQQATQRPPQPTFSGAGYRLGDEWRPSQRVEPPATGQVQKEPDVITVTLIFYRQGFTVDDGPLRDYTDPENAEFLKAINKGHVPLELLQKTGNRPVEVNLMDRKGEDYKPPPKVIKPFSGEGQRLGGPSSATPPQPTTVPTSSSNRSSRAEVDLRQPTTSVQIRLHDGTRLVAKFNHFHTVGDLRAFVQAALSKKVGFQLQTTLPVRVLVDDSQTLEAAGLLGATVVQRPV